MDDLKLPLSKSTKLLVDTWVTYIPASCPHVSDTVKAVLATSCHSDCRLECRNCFLKLNTFQALKPVVLAQQFILD